MSDPHRFPVPGLTAEPEPPALIVTGANHRYARTLMQFLLSAERQDEHRRSEWIVYDLGLSVSDREALKWRFPWVSVRPVRFTDYPPHIDIATGSFAWKPILLHEAARERKGPVFWFDSATLLHEPLRVPLATVRHTGVWTLCGQTPLMGRADARVIAALGVPQEILHLPERVAGAIGFDMRHERASNLLQAWATLARDPQYILPSGPDPRHRYDQTLLSALLLSAAWRGDIQIGDEEVDISSVHPVTYLTTRNKLWPFLPLWLDLPARAWYRLWKAGDRLALRSVAFWKSSVEGLLTSLREHYTIHRSDGPMIQGPRLGYFADPFRLSWAGETWAFVERFDYIRNKGRIAAINLATAQEVAVRGEGQFGEISCHTSFPFLLERRGMLCMIPETSGRRTVDLYQCTEFPGKWSLVRRLLADVDAADSMLVHKQGIDYLFTSVRDGTGNRHLEIFTSSDVLSAPLAPHPVNRRKLYEDELFGTGRCGGFLGFDGNGRLLRFMQSSRRHYGEGGQWMEITELSPTAFSEQPLAEAALPKGFPTGSSSHHLSLGAGEFVWDTRDRVRKWP